MVVPLLPGRPHHAPSASPRPPLLCALPVVNETHTILFFRDRAQETPPLHGGPRFWLGRLLHYVSPVRDTNRVRSAAFGGFLCVVLGAAVNAS